MIILDTNVLSECLRPKPDPYVLAWFSAQSRASLFTTTIVESEILYGIRLLPDGARKVALTEAIRAIFDHDFSGRVLSFDRGAASAYAELASSRKAAGRPIAQFDAMIAAVTYSTGAVLATRNLKDFEACKIDLLNPWAHR
jgi:predicted nucleic acid-binding protein